MNFEQIFDSIIEQKIPTEEIKKILLDLNEQNLPFEAFQGAISALKKRMRKINAPEGAIDVCGTGGDKLNTLNVSTAVCFVVAGAGVTVAKHGNKAISSRSGSADIFNELGVKVSSDTTEIEKNLREKKLCFLFAPFFHESMKNVAEIRKSLGIPTIFNFLGPLLNPANTKFQLIGVSRKDVMGKIAQVIAAEGKTAYIVHGDDGMDEISICANSTLVRVENGQIMPEEIINPEEFGFNKATLDDIKGANPKYNAEKLRNLLDGEKSAYRDIVILNSAFALRLCRTVKNTAAGIELAKKVIDEGRAKSILDLMIND